MSYVFENDTKNSSNDYEGNCFQPITFTGLFRGLIALFRG